MRSRDKAFPARYGRFFTVLVTAFALTGCQLAEPEPRDPVDEPERARAEALAECRVSVRQDGLYDEEFGGALAYRVAVDDCLRRKGFQR